MFANWPASIRVRVHCFVVLFDRVREVPLSADVIRTVSIYWCGFCARGGRECVCVRVPRCRGRRLCISPRHFRMTVCVSAHAPALCADCLGCVCNVEYARVAESHTCDLGNESERAQHAHGRLRSTMRATRNCIHVYTHTPALNWTVVTGSGRCRRCDHARIVCLFLRTRMHVHVHLSVRVCVCVKGIVSAIQSGLVRARVRRSRARTRESRADL